MLNLGRFVILSKDEYQQLTSSAESQESLTKLVRDLMDQNAARLEEINRLEGKERQGIGSLVE